MHPGSSFIYESLGMWGKYQAVKKLFAWILRTKHQFMSEAEVRITKCLAVISIEGRFTVGTSIQKREINSFHHSASKWMRKPRWPLTIGLFLPRFPCTPPLALCHIPIIVNHHFLLKHHHVKSSWCMAYHEVISYLWPTSRACVDITSEFSLNSFQVCRWRCWWLRPTLILI